MIAYHASDKFKQTIHNRSRLCVANALVYLFKIDWKIGEHYFAQKLAYYDISQNN